MNIGCTGVLSLFDKQGGAYVFRRFDGSHNL